MDTVTLAVFLSWLCGGFVAGVTSMGAALFAGLWILEALPDRTLRICVGLILVLFPFWHLAARIKPRGENWRAALIAGFLSGVLGTSTSFDGPPAAAYGLYAGWPPRVMLGTLGLYYFLRSAFQCFLQGYAGLYTDTVLHYAVWSASAAILGVILAHPVARHLSIGMMRRFLLTVIGLGGLSCLLKALLG